MSYERKGKTSFRTQNVTEKEMAKLPPRSNNPTKKRFTLREIPPFKKAKPENNPRSAKKRFDLLEIPPFRKAKHKKDSESTNKKFDPYNPYTEEDYKDAPDTPGSTSGSWNKYDLRT